MADQLDSLQVEQEPISSKCFFCGEREGDPSSVFVRETVKVTARKLSSKRTEYTSTKGPTVYIPRCAECKKAGEMGRIYVAIGTVLVLGLMVVGGIVGGFAANSIDHQWGEEGLIGGGVCGCFSGILAVMVIAGMTSGKVDTRQRSRAEEYPEVVKLKEEGYS